MNIKFARLIDFYLGSIICLILSLLKFFKPIKIKNNNSILIIELSEMGSAVLLIPTIQKIKKDCPDSKIYFLIFERHKESAKLSGLVDQIITIDDTNFIKTFFQAIIQIRKLDLKYVLDCELFSRISSIITFFSQSEMSSGFVAPKVANLYRGNLHTHPFVYNNLLHISENYLGLWKSFSNKETPYLREKIVVENFSTPNLKINTKLGKLITGNTVLFNPDPGLIEIRGWPIEYFIELGKILITKHNYNVAIIGLDSANNIAEKCQAALGEKCLNLVGKTKTLEDLLGVYSSAKLLITADSGPAHLAPLVDLPAIVLFGPESPLRFSPMGNKVSTISSNLSCSPCLSAFNLRNSSCYNNLCMKKITVSTVYEKVLEHL